MTDIDDTTFDTSAAAGESAVGYLRNCLAIAALTPPLRDAVGTVLAELERLGRVEQAAPCGDSGESLMGTYLLVCALPAGHRGFHRDDEGASWTNFESSALDGLFVRDLRADAAMAEGADLAARNEREVVIGAGSPETSALTHCPECGSPEWLDDGRRGWNPIDVECEVCAGTYDDCPHIPDRDNPANPNPQGA